MSTQGLISNPQGVAVQKKRFGVYDMMLLISFFAIVIGIVCLWLEASRFPSAKPPAVPPPPPVEGAAAMLPDLDSHLARC